MATNIYGCTGYRRHGREVLHGRLGVLLCIVQLEWMICQLLCIVQLEWMIMSWMYAYTRLDCAGACASVARLPPARGALSHELELEKRSFKRKLPNSMQSVLLLRTLKPSCFTGSTSRALIATDGLQVILADRPC